MSIVMQLDWHETWGPEKCADDTSPLIGIELIDTNQQDGDSYVMQKQLKPFSMATQKLGLAWSERYRQYVIPEHICLNKKKLTQYVRIIQKILDRYNRGKSIVKRKELTKEANQSYFTKAPIIKAMQAFINSKIEDSTHAVVLDPAAGEGNLTDGIKTPKNQIWCIEPNKKCCEKLRKKGYLHIIPTSFETALNSELLPEPTHIIMNPPFHHQLDIDFFNLACSHTKKGGVIAAIVSENSIYEEIRNFRGKDLDENFPQVQAKKILEDPESSKLSERLRKFLQNIVNCKSFELSAISGPWCFEGTNARAYLLKAVVRERELGTKMNDKDDLER